MSKKYTSLLMIGMVMLVSCTSGKSDRALPKPVEENLAPPLTAVRLKNRNGYFVDPEGREVLLRGVNVNSWGEYWQFHPDYPTTVPFDAEDMDYVASLGFNLVRLVITWSLVEPEPGVYDDQYLAEVAEASDALWERGIYTLVDLHQDAWGPHVAAREDEDCAENSRPSGGWDGAPLWATLVSEETSRCVPSLSGRYIREMNPASREAWAALLENKPGPGEIGLQDRYGAMLGHVAEAFAPNKGVMGIDIINEPNAIFGADEFDGLENMYRKAVEGIRAGEERAGIPPRIILFEPSVNWNNVPFGSTVDPFSDDPQLAYGPHIYQGMIALIPLDESQVERIREESASYGGVPVLSGEWGVHNYTAGDPDSKYPLMLELQDREHWSMAFWQYQAGCGDPHGFFRYVYSGISTDECIGQEDETWLSGDRAYLLGRPAIHYAPGPIDKFEWNIEKEELFAEGEAVERGSELVLFIPGNRPQLNAEFTGVGEVEVIASYGGRRITAPATGGPWSVTVK